MKGIIMLILFLSFSVPIADANSAKPKTVQINFNEVDIKDFTKVVSEALKKNFIIPPTLKGKVTIVSPSPVPISQLFNLYIAVLDEMGYQAVDYGNYVKILRKAEASRENVSVKFKNIDGGDRIVTYDLIPKFLSVLRVQPIVRSLSSSIGKVILVPDVNALVITDKEKNLKKILTVVNRIDKFNGNFHIESFEVKNGKAEDVVKILTALLQKTFAFDLAKSVPIPGRDYYHFAVDKRTNTIYVVGTSKVIEEISQLIKKIDKPLMVNEGNIHIVKLNYAFSDDIAKILTKLFQGSRGKKNIGLTGEVKVVSDKSTNTLIVLSSPDDFKVIKGLIESIDIKKPQVFVEAQIVEMSIDKLLQIGVEWKFLARGKSVPFGGSLYGGLPLSEGYPALSTGGLLLGIAKWREGTPDIGLLLNAYAKEGGINVIATPQILTLDNEDAEINITQVIPYSTGVKYDANNNPVISYDYKDVGISLKITPHITASGEVRLKIYEKVEDVTGYANADQTAPITSKREAKTTVDVQDGQTLVIGGLIKTKKLTTVEKVPVLGNIPLVGNLFKKTGHQTEKTNLLVFITPHIVKSKEEEDNLTKKKVGLYNRNLERMKLERRGITSDLRGFGKFDLGEGIKVYER